MRRSSRSPAPCGSGARCRRSRDRPGCVDAVADRAADDRAGHGRCLAAVALADRVAEHAADDRADHRAGRVVAVVRAALDRHVRRSPRAARWSAHGRRPDRRAAPGRRRSARSRAWITARPAAVLRRTSPPPARPRGPGELRLHGISTSAAERAVGASTDRLYRQSGMPRLRASSSRQIKTSNR